MRVDVATLTFFAAITGAAVIGCGVTGSTPEGTEPPTPSAAATEATTSPELIAEGQRVFRFETFGDEQLWTDKRLSNRRVVDRSDHVGHE